METIGDRIRELRTKLNLTLDKFSARIGSKPSTISTYEKGRSTPISPIITAICREYRVSEEWLRDGTGEMFLQSSDVSDEIAALAKAYPNLTNESLLFIKRFVTLPKEVQDATWRFFVGLVGEIQEKPEAVEAPADPEPPDANDPTIMERISEGLKASDEKKSSASSGTSTDTA